MKSKDYKEIMTKLDMIHDLYDIYSSYTSEAWPADDVEDDTELSFSEEEADEVEKELFWIIYKTAHMMNRWGLMTIFDNSKDRCYHEAEALRAKQKLADMVQHYHYMNDICECFKSAIDILDNIMIFAKKELARGIINVR